MEVETLEQLAPAIAQQVAIVLLDNMAPDRLREAVTRVGASGVRMFTEACGGITPQTTPTIAATGANVFSMGWITHSAPRLDVALDVVLG